MSIPEKGYNTSEGVCLWKKKYTAVIWKATQQLSRVTVQKLNQNHVHFGVTDSSSFLRENGVTVSLAARPLS
jgi:hypothetical protein